MKATVLDGYTLNPGDNPWTPVAAHCDLEVFERTAESEILNRCVESPIVLTNKTPISGQTIAALPNLKFISVLATGTNLVDLEAARQRHIPVSNVPDYGTDSVAQHVMAVILARIHKPWDHDRAIREGQWQSSVDFSFWLSPLTELADQTIGIIGFGRIGRRVAEIAAAFGMNVLAYNPTLTGKIRPAWQRFDWCPLPQIFRESDYVTLHCPLTDDNAEFVNAEMLELMKPTGVLINTARGGLVNETDLAKYLNEDRIGGACLDVVSQEPIQPDNPLLAARNCLITPHNAWATVQARQRLMHMTANNVEAFTGGQPINVVN